MTIVLFFFLLSFSPPVRRNEALLFPSDFLREVFDNFEELLQVCEPLFESLILIDYARHGTQLSIKVTTQILLNVSLVIFAVDFR